MSVEATKFAKLIDLAKETSSEKRRDLLREVSDVFFDENEANRSATECQMFDEILVAVATDMTEEIRKNLAVKVARSKSPLRRTARRFASDTLTVARPVLQHADSLTEDDLVEIVNTKPQSHLMAVSKRKNLTEVVSDALVVKGEDPVVASLLENQTASISRKSFESITDRAKKSSVLQAPLVKRKTVPLDLLNEMYAVVEDHLRKHLLTRFENVSEAEFNEALKHSRARINTTLGGQPSDLDDAKKWLKAMTEARTLEPRMLIQLLRDGKRTRFLVALSYYAEMPFNIVMRLVSDKDIDALAILGRAANLEKPLFTSIAVNIIGGDNGVSQANKYAEMYDEVSPMAAQRAVRFWKVRNATAAKPQSNAA